MRAPFQARPRDSHVAVLVAVILAGWMAVAWRTPDAALRGLQYDPVFGWFADFFYHYLPAGRSVLTGQDAGRYFFYPPAALVLFAALGPLSDASAACVWALTLGLSTIVIVRATALAAGSLPYRYALSTALVLGS